MSGLATETQDPPVRSSSTKSIDDALASVAAIATRLGRDDLAIRVDEVGRRVARTETVVCVVGEFKQGKSALINALLGQPVCPVDDDLATTAVTVVRHADEPVVTIRRRVGGEVMVETVPHDGVAAWTLEDRGHGGPDPLGGLDRPDGRGADTGVVEMVEIGLPHPLLRTGLALVDTPGVGGLNAGHAAATLAFLPSADALVFVTDASAELSATEIAFLASARRAGPPVFVAVTKIDMYPAWRRIVALDIGHLRAAGSEVEPFALSSVLESIAAEAGDLGLDRDSGFGAFGTAILGDALATARGAARSAAIFQLEPVIDQLREPLAVELSALERPDDARRIAADLASARERLATLAAADASWAVRLEDEFAALRTRVTFAFAGRIRQILRESQGDLEAIDPAQDWLDLSQRVQEQTAAAVGDAFLAATDGAAAIQTTIAGLLADEAVGFDAAGAPITFDVRELWDGRPEFSGRTRRGVLASLGVFTGAKVGVEMLGMLGTLLGAAIVGPAVLGVALAFGGKEVLSERRRQLTDRRQAARSFLSDFVEGVRFETDGRLATLIDDVQRQMRARFADRIRELTRTYTDSAEALEAAATSAAATRAGRQRVLEAEIAALDAAAERIRALGGGQAPAS
ncbi:MAG: dynamin family protein [Candidatus Limnocylindrales bacterium]